MTPDPPSATPSQPPRLLDQLREAARAAGHAEAAVTSFASWSCRYILFHGKRHPAEMGAAEVAAFLTSLAVQGKVAASTQNQALSALLFLYREVLQRRAAVARRRHQGQTARASARGADARRGPNRPPAARRSAAAHGASRSSAGTSVRMMYSTTSQGVITIFTSTDFLRSVCQFSNAVAISNNHSRGVLRCGADQSAPSVFNAAFSTKPGACGHGAARSRPGARRENLPV